MTAVDTRLRVGLAPLLTPETWDRILTRAETEFGLHRRGTERFAAAFESRAHMVAAAAYEQGRADAAERCPCGNPCGRFGQCTACAIRDDVAMVRRADV